MPYKSQHHSNTLQCTSFKFKGFDTFVPTGFAPFKKLFAQNHAAVSREGYIFEVDVGPQFADV